MPSSELLVPTPLGAARLLVDAARRSRATLVLGHGAGGGPGGGAGAPDLAALAARLPDLAAVSVVRVEQPWRVAGRRVAPAPAVLDRAWLAAWPQVTGAVADLVGAAGPPVAGGRSAGARVACRTARTVGAVGVLALAFPLHPPGRPERSRLPELLGAGTPTLVVQGERDAFGGPGELPPGPYDVVAVPDADHSFAVRRSAPGSPRQALDRVVAAVAGWLDRLLGPPGRLRE